MCCLCQHHSCVLIGTDRTATSSRNMERLIGMCVLQPQLPPASSHALLSSQRAPTSQRRSSRRAHRRCHNVGAAVFTRRTSGLVLKHTAALSVVLALSVNDGLPGLRGAGGEGGNADFRCSGPGFLQSLGGRGAAILWDRSGCGHVSLPPSPPPPPPPAPLALGYIIGL